MRAIIGAKLLTSKAAQPGLKPFEIYDERLPGFTLRVQPSGIRSYYARTGRSTRVVLGKVGELKPDEARERCEKVLGNVAHGREPMEGIDGADVLTLGTFIEDIYSPWVSANRPRTAEDTLGRLKLRFGDWYRRPIGAISVADVENWRIGRLDAGNKATTIVRDLNSLASVLTRAMKLGKLRENVCRRVDRPRIDRTPKVRYLDRAEEQRLRTALAERDAEIQAARESANAWRLARKQEAMPPLPHYGDHLTPAVLLSMNTGLRRGELLSVRWSAVDLKRALLTIEGSTAKSLQTRHVPLNAEALEVLKHWRDQCPVDAERVFALEWLYKAWDALLVRAGVSTFRWHDLRHHFASRLVQAGVPLNTVRELLGHGSLAMTLRYAHLAPDQKAEAVAKLVRPT
jgi:integrase